MADRPFVPGLTCRLGLTALLGTFLCLSSPAAHAQHDPGTNSGPSLDLPRPLPVTRDSPMDEMYYADRGMAPPAQQQASEGDGSPVLVQFTIPASFTGTGFQEKIQYQLPTTYDEFDPNGHPMVLAYHGFGFSANSVAALSTIDEECEARDWIYLSVTGIDDQLYGPPLSQRNTTAAILWMLDNFNIDTERLYMVGFSMGAGVTANYTERHRNPNSPMFAAIGLVAGSFDWTQSYNTEGMAVQDLMEIPENFDGPPTTVPFNYQRSSSLHFDTATYPPLPGTYDISRSMAVNLEHVPIYTVWDTLDDVQLVPVQAPVFKSFIQALGGTIVDNPVTCPGGPPLNHSWGLLDEVDLFDFFDGKTVDPYPQDFTAVLDTTGFFSFANLEQRTLGEFSHIDAVADDVADSIVITGVDNVTAVRLDAAGAGLGDATAMRLTATSADIDGFDVVVEGLDDPPSYMLSFPGGALVKGVDSDPDLGTLTEEVPGNGTLDVTVIVEPWTTKLFTAPQPVPIGFNMTLTIDAPSGQGAVTAFLLVSTDELLTPIQMGAGRITASLVAPNILLPLPLNGNGDIALPASIPNDPVFSGLALPSQAIVVDAVGDLVSISNLWQLRIQ